MNDCSKLVKLCGLKSVIECATFNGTNRQEINKAFNNNREKFNRFVLDALKHKQDWENSKLIKKINGLHAQQLEQTKRARDLLK